MHKSQPELQSVLSELASREPIFHRPEFGTTRADFEQMTAPDFFEIGASGRRYDRTYVLDELERRYAHADTDEWEATNFECRCLGQDLFLLTYSLLQSGTRRSLRSTVWRRVSDNWQIVFHQGTLVESAV